MTHCRAQHQAAGHGDHVLRVAVRDRPDRGDPPAARGVPGGLAALHLRADARTPGSTPEEVERTVLRPVEEALSTMTGIKRMDCERQGGRRATIFMQFTDWDRDVAIAASEARERIDAIRDDLPDDLQRYNVLKFSTTDEPVLRVRLASETQT